MNIQVDQIIRSSRKTIALIVQADGKLVVRAPLRFSDAQILSFVNENMEWIQKKKKQVKAAAVKTRPKRYADGEEFYYLGQPYALKIVDKAATALTLNGRFLLSQKALPRANRVFIAWYRAEAVQVLGDRVRWYAAKMRLSYKKIKITSARTRWGSCSIRGTLSFPWRLVMAPMPVIDYVVVHELSHLRVHNHSRAFWQVVGEVFPDYKQRIKWLKINGHLFRLE